MHSSAFCENVKTFRGSKVVLRVQHMNVLCKCKSILFECRSVIVTLRAFYFNVNLCECGSVFCVSQHFFGANVRAFPVDMKKMCVCVCEYDCVRDKP